MDIEKRKDLIEHLPVLGGDANFGIKAFITGKSLNERCHLDGFGTSAEYA